MLAAGQSFVHIKDQPIHVAAAGAAADPVAPGVPVALPGVANDFIALLKDSSLASVITVVELTKRMAITAVDTRGWLLPGLAWPARRSTSR